MSTEDEFSKWLRRKDKSFEENLRFAIKAWQSVEFVLSTKYEIILKWISEHTDLVDENLNGEDLTELLKLRAQPGLISKDVKHTFIKWCLQMSARYEHDTRKWCELLGLLLEFELLQDLLRKDYELQSKVYEALFISYEKYLEKIGDVFLSTSETEFVASILKTLKESIKRCGDVKEFETNYTSIILPSVTNVMLMMRTLKVDFFQELTEIENLLTMEMRDDDLIRRITKMSLHVRLLALEYSIVNRKNVDEYTKVILENIFNEFASNNFTTEDTSLNLTMAAYVLEMFCRHDVNINIVWSEGQSALQFLGKRIYDVIKGVQGSHLKEVLMVLCAALRLNPLILEENVFKITANVILATKSGNIKEKQLFEEYLVLLMDMFRRLSRAEKFVSNLMKALNTRLEKVDISAYNKRKAPSDEKQTPSKKKKIEKSATEEHLNQGNQSKYLDILFQDFFKPVLTQQKLEENVALSASISFGTLQNYWPSNPVGVAFSKIITGLVTKPSVVIWKTLLFALKELIESYKEKKTLNEKELLQMDFHVALLAQYFAGSKLAEQTGHFFNDINSQRQFTTEVLQLFGKFILDREHQPRTMAAFLELSYFATSMELMLVFYRPDGSEDVSLQPQNILEKVHDFLSPQQWLLIQQRVLNFGQSSCKYLLQRLNVQKSQSSFLLLMNSSAQEKLQLERSFETSDNEQLYSFLKSNNAKWFISQLPRSSKVPIAEYVIKSKDLFPIACNDLDLLEFSCLAVYENICSSISSKNALLKSLSGEFEEIRECTDISATETLIKRLIDAINQRADEEYNIKKIDADAIKANLDILSQLPVGHLRRQRKTIIFALHLCLYRDLKSGKEDDLAAQSLEIMKDILHFGQQVLMFKYFGAKRLLTLLPMETCWQLYEFLFSTIRNEEKGTDKFLEDLAAIMQDSQSLDNEQRKLLLIAIVTLSSITGPSAKRLRKHLMSFLKIFSEYLNSHFMESNDGTSKKDKKFVLKTLAGFASYASFLLAKAAKNGNEKENQTEKANDAALEQDIDENFRRINKIYIGHSMDYGNPHALRLMSLALSHRELLHLDQDEIEFVLTNYWTQINADLQQPEDPSNKKTIETAVKLIISNKTNEDLLLTLKHLADNTESKNISNILKLLRLIAKCPFSTIKGAIFNEMYKKITFNVTLRLKRDEQQQFTDHDIILDLLVCHQAILENKMVPISTDTMDSILSFLMEINIKKFPLCDTNIKVFNSLHAAVTEVCLSLIKQRNLLLLDRAPQYMHIFKDLIQSVVWYKSDRQKDTTLPSNELDNLAELAMKLEALMHLIAQHSVGFKRVAPFILTFIINLMVKNQRPTTLYNKVKTHVESICYDLVGICDHRAKHFILRCSNEAGRQLYEVLVKDYQKYHKFKGKV
ncbi:uncharacterized protein [Musca autumnalis]|uniref:uncharacterized protein n=1 Tax=Musca autumnalis TaxID=221902 RepID=UPI003CF30678